MLCVVCISAMDLRSKLQPPPQLFFSTAQQRLALARQRFFDEGQRPTGLVSEEVIQSWSRCVHLRRNPRERLEFEPVTRSRVHSSLSRSRDLLGAAAAPLAELEAVLSGSGCWALLVDATGVVLNVGRRCPGIEESIMPVLGRVGVNVGETALGTNAPGIAARTGQTCTVLGGEHFFEVVRPLFCTASPIRDAQGEVVAVLDLSLEGRPFGFDAEMLVAQYAVSIENRLLLAKAADQVVLRFHTATALLDSGYEALLGIDARGQVAWMNDLASRWLGHRGGNLESLFGLSLDAVTGLLGQDRPALVHLTSGLAVWVRAVLHARDGAAQLFALGSVVGDVSAPAGPPPACEELPAAPADPEPAPRLDVLSRQHIDKMLAACGGNISSAARMLGVSRGLIYRHLRATRTGTDENGAAPADRD